MLNFLLLLLLNNIPLLGADLRGWGVVVADKCVRQFVFSCENFVDYYYFVDQ